MPVYNFTTLDDPKASNGTQVYGINNAGQMVGGYDIFTHGFLLSGGTYTTVDDGTAGTNAWGINGSGQIVGQFVNGGTTDGFVLNNAVYTTLIDPDPSAVSTAAHDINSAGVIVGSFRRNTAPVLKGFVFDPKFGYSTLFNPAASANTIPYGINDAGQIVGSYDLHGFLFISGTYTKLDDPAATGYTEAHGINNLGQIVGTYQDARGQHGFLYSGGTYINFDFPGVNGQTFATGINDAGQIVGYYLTNTYHGFVLTITPNPPPPAGTTADMILRHGADGQYEIYDIGGNSLLAAYQLGTVGTDWKYVGLGGFFGSDTTDMILRNSGTGGFEVYDISNNLITNAAFLGRSARNGSSWVSAIFRASAKPT
jgi:probable HAF family extracellular repeat protein